MCSDQTSYYWAASSAIDWILRDFLAGSGCSFAQSCCGTSASAHEKRIRAAFVFVFGSVPALVNWKEGL